MSTSEPSGSTNKELKANTGQAERLHSFAHAIRNRLTGLIEAVRFVKEEVPAEQRAEVAGFGERQFFQALREVEALMDDLGVARGITKIKAAPIDMSDVIAAGIASCEHRYTNKQQHIVSNLPASLPLVGDRELLIEAIQALLSNASKFSAPGTQIEVNATLEEGTVVMGVVDNGVGMTKEDLQEIFTRYAWLGSTSTAGEAQGRSTLARVKQWIEAHGGTIHAGSEGPGKGATLTLRLPAGWK